MIEEMLGMVSWPAAILLSVGAVVWGWHVREDSAQSHELRLQLIEECAVHTVDAEARECVVRFEEELGL